LYLKKNRQKELVLNFSFILSQAIYHCQKKNSSGKSRLTPEEGDNTNQLLTLAQQQQLSLIDSLLSFLD